MSPTTRLISLFTKNISTSSFKFLRSPEHMTWIILIGSFVVDILILILLIFNFTTFEHLYLRGRIIASIVTLIYLCIVGFFLHKKYIRIGAWMLLVLYGVIGILILHIWGINAPIGILIFSFAIVLAGVMLGARYIMIVTGAIIILLVTLQHFSVMGITQPDRSMLDDTSTYMDVMNYSIFFCIFALVSWLSGSRMENALARAVRAESTLKKERDMLSDRVEEQTRRLKDAQHKELKQLYKFAELGQLTTIILHELANHLSVLTLDIDDLKERHQNSLAIEHAKESISYLDSIIDQVRNQINDSEDTHAFDAIKIIQDSLEQLQRKLKDSNLKLLIKGTRLNKYFIFGDPLRLSQSIMILVTNAAQANKNKESEIAIEVSSTKTKILISVKDFGTGITPEARRSLFQPQKSKKGTGLGIGLYITKQIIDTHFKGKIWLSPETEYTQFNIEIPRTK